MDMRWDEYVQEWGYTPVEYFESSAYKAKYKDDEVFIIEITKYLLILNILVRLVNLGEKYPG